jgi:hypothetical protein
MAGKPFQSKLTPHFALISEMRRKRQSWQDIVNHLKALGITSDKGSVCAFFKRHRRRPTAMGMESENERPLARSFIPQKPSFDLPELTESLPPQSDFDVDELTSPPMEKTKSKKWTVLQPNP